MRADECRRAEQHPRRRREEDTRAERGGDGRATCGCGDDVGGAAGLLPPSLTSLPAARAKDDRLVPRVDRLDARGGDARDAAQHAAVDGEHGEAIRVLAHIAHDAAPAAETADAEADAVVKPVAPNRVVGVEGALVLGPHRPSALQVPTTSR